ncbi:MAG: hypothetical protein JO322_12220 [Candidatus Eremiobacteraeota bacterium]|nr:hypothetical protein [Candidatus Eremiobacteraeota bacterium]
MLMLSACGGGSSGTSSPMPQTNTTGGGSETTMSTQSSTVTAQGFTTAVDTDTSNLDDNDYDNDDSVLKKLDDQRTIGSTVDPINGDQNPYGLDVAKSDNGKIKAGDLVICNFNNNNAGGNVQGQGTTIVALHPHVGSTPLHIAQDPSLLGCDALALAPDDTIWAAAFVANDNPLVSPSGMLLTTLPGGPWHGPFGQAFAPHPGFYGSVAAFYETNAGDGSIVRINIRPGKPFSFDVIATGFPINHGAPGSILGPSGLQYDARRDRLFIVDGANNAVYVLRHVSSIPAHGLSVDPNGTSFDGPFRHRARVVFIGSPLNGPISSAVLHDGHLAIGNTTDPTGKNLIVEITTHGKVLYVRNVDTGNAGAIFGMVATGRDIYDQKLYYNNDNDNTLRVLTK